MESLLSNYASSEDEDEQVDPKPQPRPPPPKPSTTSKSSPNFFSLPPPKSSCSSSSSSSSLFSSVPPPKATQPKPPPSGPNPKKVVQFKPPIDPSFFNSSNLRDDDDDGEPADKKPSKDSFSVSKSQPFVLPPPKHSFGLASSASRRALVHTETSTAAPTAATSGDRDKEKVFKVGSYEQGAENGSGSDHTTSDSGAGNAEYQNYENYGYYSGNTEDGSAPVMPYSNVGNEQYGDYGRCYSRYTADWAGGSGVSSVPAQPLVESIGRVKGKRGRNEVPTEIIEVKQDELMSNRPRENQTKMTGIAFGPAYQPVSSAKSKPSKLHKRKHQIGSLYFDMKQKEMELAERRAKGFQTKAETQGKYGW